MTEAMFGNDGSGDEGEDGDGTKKRKTKKEIMQELIAKSKYVLSTRPPRISLPPRPQFSMSDVRRPGRTRKKHPNDGKKKILTFRSLSLSVCV